MTPTTTARPFSLDAIAIGPNPRMRAMFDYIARIAPGQGTVLVTGESGTGKEIVANALHLQSPRRRRPFVAVSCALLSDSLVESELFGHERGAFTGAVGARPGRFERADGGTLFLDDIDDVPLGMQVKLLRAIQNRTVERVGGSDPIPFDVRIVAGTKRDLRQLVAEGKFREDLFYRLNVLAITLPPLRERRDDIPTLIDFFLTRFFQRRGADVPALSEGARDILLSYDWPGNVRELENACEHIVESCTCGRVGLGCLGASLLFPSDAPLQAADEIRPQRAAAAESNRRVAAAESSPGSDTIPLDERIRRFEAGLIQEALAATGGNKSRAAMILGIKRSTLGDRIVRCGLDGWDLG